MLKFFTSKESQKEKETISKFVNPFVPSAIYRIEFEIEHYKWNAFPTYKSKVRFDTDNTVGTHYIESTSFDQLIKDTESFIKTL